MRVIGSHAISTMPVLSPETSAGFGWVVVMLPSPHLLVAGGQLAAPLAPLWFPVELLLGDLAQAFDDAAHGLAGGPGHERAGGRVHERLELVREARHRAADADAAHVRAAAHAVDPAALGHVALHDRAPAAQLDQAFGLAVLGGEVALLVVAAAVAALVHGLPEEPLGPQRLVEGDH